MLRYIIYAFIFYWLFRFIFNFIIPVFKATKQMKQQVRQFQDRAGDRNIYRKPAGEADTRTRPAAKPKAGDYIDFEELR